MWNFKGKQQISLLISVLLVVSSFVYVTSSLRSANVAHHYSSTFNYGAALQESIYFYEEQSSGPKPSWNTVPWLGSSGLHDGADVGLDLTGGWLDDASHIKFGLPMAYSATVLAWGVLANKDAYAQDGQLDVILHNLRWVNDYFIRSHPAPDVFYGQVGDPTAEHAFWGPAEVEQTVRPAYKIDDSCPGSDLAGQTAASMAAASMLFKSTDPAYTATLLTNAEQLYTFADTHRGLYSDCIKAASGSYKSSGYTDELVWGAIWLYLATHQESYLSKAESYYAQYFTHAYKWTMDWNDVTYGCYVLLAQITGEQQYVSDAERFLDWWTVGVNGSRVPYSPGGEAVLMPWGSLREAANTAFLALVFADYLGKGDERYTRYHDFALQQINYILGANPRKCSYLVGFGSCYPQQPHSREAHGSWTNDIANPTNERHILYGALVGGPILPDDAFTNDRQNYESNEPAEDFEAALTGAFARLYAEYGGHPLDSLPDKPKDDDEIYSTASISSSGSNYTEVSVHFVNKTGWPPRVTSNLSLRYYFTLEAGVTPDMITLKVMQTQCGQQVSGPTHYTGQIYYVTVSCAGVPIYPGGPDAYLKLVRFRIVSAGAWDATNDWSYQEIASLGNSFVKTNNIPVYDGQTLVWGVNPTS